MNYLTAVPQLPPPADPHAAAQMVGHSAAPIVVGQPMVSVDVVAAADEEERLKALRGSPRPNTFPRIHRSFCGRFGKCQ